MHEIITLQIGQCGNQIGNEFWRKIAAEHHIDVGQMSHQNEDSIVLGNTSPFFYLSDTGRYIPRAILMDLEPRVISQSLPFFNEENIFVSNEGGGAGNNWAHGYSVGKKCSSELLEMVNREIEACDSVDCFYVMHSVAGGTGSGMGSSLLEALRENFPKKFITSYSVFPTNEECSEVVVQPYNTVLAVNILNDTVNSIIAMDNGSLGKIACLSARQKHPTYSIMNALASSVVSATTETIRFPGHMYGDVASLHSCCVPIESFRFLIPSFTPFSLERRIARKLSVRDIMKRLLQKSSKLCTYEQSGRHASLALFEIIGTNTPEEVWRSVEQMYDESWNNFVSWMPPFFQVAISSRKRYTGSSYWGMPFLDMSGNIEYRHDGDVSGPIGVALENTTGIASFLGTISTQFDRLFKRNAFIDSYKKYDADLELFTESREHIQRIIDNYEGCEVATPL